MSYSMYRSSTRPRSVLPAGHEGVAEDAGHPDRPEPVLRGPDLLDEAGTRRS
jgi:hypothetical protein